MNLKILNSRDVKNIRSIIEKQWGCLVDLDYGFLQDEMGWIYIVNKSIRKFPLEKLVIGQIGIKFGKIIDKEKILLTIEGSEIVGPSVKKNIIELTTEQSEIWLRGRDIRVDRKESIFLVYNKEDFLGSGKIRNKKLINSISKKRIIKSKS